MTFKVEDGTGLEDATSYVDIFFADSYFQRLGFTAWSSMTLEDKQFHLETGTEYADLRWGNCLSGSLLKLTQALEFPRRGLTDRYGRKITGVPGDWKKAVCEYTMQSTKAPLMSDTTSADAALKKKKTVVGPITTEKEFATASSASSYPVYPKADTLVKNYLGPNFGPGSGGVIRN